MRQSRVETLNRALSRPERRGLRRLLLAQGGYYLTTGLWPLFASHSFQKITGPKMDFWLARTIGLVIGVAGGVLLLAAGRQRLTPETALVGAGVAASLGGTDVVYSLRGRISPVYLLDALAQAVFLGGWAWAAIRLIQGRRLTGLPPANRDLPAVARRARWRTAG